MAANPNPIVMTKKHKTFIAAFQSNLGIVTKTCKALKITTQTYYRWRKLYPEFAREADAVEDFVLDEVEHVAHQMIIEDRNPAMTIFYLKTKGKKRGYIEKTEIEHTNGDLRDMRDLLNNLVLEHEQPY